MRMYLALLFIASMSSLHAGAGLGSPISFNPDEQKCFIEKNFESPLVIGYKRDLSCGREGVDYHVVYYNNRARNESARDEDDEDDDEEDTNLETIKVTVRPDNNQTYLGTLVIVLSSVRKVSWKLRFQRVSYDSVVHLWMSGHSKLLKEQNRQVGIRHLHYMKSISELKKNLRRNYEGVKFNQSPVKRMSALVRVGAGSRVCQMRPPVVVPSEGCVVPWSVDVASMTYVFVVEAIDPNPEGDPWSSKDDPTPVYINLYPKNGRSMKVHAQLVLKSTRPVNWILQANKLKGVLDQIAEHQGDTSEVNLRNSRFVHEKLSELSGQRLIDWVSEKYHSPVAYIRTEGANSFNISVDPDLATVEPPLDKLKQIHENLIVDCQDGSFKIFLLNHSDKNVELYLSEELCPPMRSKEDDILFWNVTQDQCHTKKELNGTLHNKLFMRGPYQTWIQLPVRCAVDNLANLLSDPRNPDIQLKVFADPALMNQFVSFPLRTQLAKSYYIVASLSADFPLRARLDSCTATSNGNPVIVEQLISNGCLVSDMVRRFEGPDGSTDGFEFIYDDLDESKSLDIRCNASMCVGSRHVSVAGLEQCHSKWLRSCHSSSSSSSPINHVVSKTYLTPPVVQIHVGPFEDPDEGAGFNPNPKFDGEDDDDDDDDKDDDEDDDDQPGFGGEDRHHHGHMHGVERTDPRRVYDHSDPSRPSRDPPAKSFPVPPSSGCDVDYGRTDEGLVGITTVICIAFAAFAIGILLIGSLWLIHSRTGPRKKKASIPSRCVPRPLHAKCADSNQGTLTNQACCPGFNGV